jgi:hypothetical protein
MLEARTIFDPNLASQRALNLGGSCRVPGWWVLGSAFGGHLL